MCNNRWIMHRCWHVILQCAVLLCIFNMLYNYFFPFCFFFFYLRVLPPLCTLKSSGVGIGHSQSPSPIHCTVQLSLQDYTSQCLLRSYIIRSFICCTVCHCLELQAERKRGTTGQGNTQHSLHTQRQCSPYESGNDYCEGGWARDHTAIEHLATHSRHQTIFGPQRSDWVQYHILSMSTTWYIAFDIQWEAKLGGARQIVCS